VDNIDYKRYGHTANLIGQNIYLFGGTTEKGQKTNDLFVLNSEELGEGVRSVKNVQGFFPTHRSLHGSAVIGNNLYIYGGLITKLSMDYHFDSNIHVLNTKTKQWLQIP
jgi:N-acetylneuraminic acid mutarotase